MYSLAALAKNPLYAAKSGVGVNVVRPLEVRILHQHPYILYVPPPSTCTTKARPWYYVLSISITQYFKSCDFTN